MELNKQQRHAKSLILEFITNSKDDNFFLLSGYAGTGKSTTISDIIADYQRLNYSWIAMSAPTHKATQVLRKKGKERGSHNIDYSTIHQLLGLTAEIDYNTGEQVFTQVGNNNLKKYDLIIIDECSMIDSELWGIIQSEVFTHDKKVVLLGDEAQLPPINDPISPIFSEDMPNYKLTDVMRTNNLNPLADIINDARQHKLCNHDSYSEDLTQGAWIIEDKKTWLNTLLRSFKSPQYNDNPDYAKAIAWTNPNYQVTPPPSTQHPIFNRTNASKALKIPIYRVLKCFTVDNILWVQYLDNNQKTTTKLTIPQLIRAMEKCRRAKAKDIVVELIDNCLYVAHNYANGNSYELYYDSHNHYCSCPDFHNTNTALQLANPSLAEHTTIYCKHIIALVQQFKPHLITT